MVVHVIDGFKLSVDRGPNCLFVRLRPKRHFADDIPQIANQLWAIASRHFIYRIVLEFDELDTLPAEVIDQLVLLQERLTQCDGALRLCGLSHQATEALRDCGFESALPNHATRQDAVLGCEVTALRDKLKQLLESSGGDGFDAPLPIKPGQPILQ